jgi:hypothetical protein
VFFIEGKGTAEEDPTVRIAEMVQADPDWTYVELASNHLAIVNDPEAVADVLLSLV